MTRAELHSIPGFHPASLLHAAAFLSSNIPRQKSGDATAIIQNEGRMNGFLDCIEALISAASPQPPKVEPKPFQPYADPNQPKTENPNRP